MFFYLIFRKLYCIIKGLLLHIEHFLKHNYIKRTVQEFIMHELMNHDNEIKY